MQHNIQPKYNTINATCSCGNTFKIGSVLGQDLQLDICSACHPFYTGNQKIVDTEGRVDSFAKRFGNFSVLSGGKTADAKAADTKDEEKGK